MDEDRHVRAESYARTEEGRQTPATLALTILEHLAAHCPECRRNWQGLSKGQGTIRALLLDELEALPPLQREEPDAHLPVFSHAARREDEEIERLRALRTSARKQTWTLAQADPEERPRVIRGAHSQYRSRAVAEYLLDRCREVIRNDPEEALSLASLVPIVLHCTPGAKGAPWAFDLGVLARAWKANALRVTGDLPAADRLFAALRHDLVKNGARVDAAVVAELRSLEASLRISQRRLPEARELLREAELLYRSNRDAAGIIRTQLKRGNLALEAGDSEAALVLFQCVAPRLDRSSRGTNLKLSVVNGWIAALCDLRRFAEAQEVLDRHVDCYEASSDLHAGSILRAMQGRVSSGLGHYGRAATAFEEAYAGFLDTGRPYDAALVALDLAETLFLNRRWSELKVLARGLLPAFTARRVTRETLATLQLLVRAVQFDRVSAETLGRLRRRLAVTGRSKLPPREC